jgi:formate dehydrogenase major subunit
MKQEDTMSEKIRFQLDGQEVIAERGMTIWEVANGSGLVIPSCLYGRD